MKKTIKLTALLLALLLCSCVAFVACSNDDITGDESDTTESVVTPDNGDQTPDNGDQTPDNGDQTPDNGDQTPDNGDDENKAPEQTNPWGDADEGETGKYTDWYAPSGN